DPEALVCRPRLFERVRILGREGKAGAVVDRSPRNLREHVQDARVVLVTAYAVRLDAEMWSDDELVGLDDLHRQGNGHQRDATDGEHATEAAHRNPERFEVIGAAAIRADGHEDAKGCEVREHGRTAV